jgi:hypothetical protein
MTPYRQGEHPLHWARYFFSEGRTWDRQTNEGRMALVRAWGRYLVHEEHHVIEEAREEDPIPILCYDPTLGLTFWAGREEILYRWENDPAGITPEDAEFIKQLRREDLPANGFFMLLFMDGFYFWRYTTPAAETEGDPAGN